MEDTSHHVSNMLPTASICNLELPLFLATFFSANFWRKLSFISTLSTLSSLVPVDYIYIPDEVMRYVAALSSSE